MKSISKEKLKDAVFIIDGSSFLYRAFYSIPPLTTSQGLSVGAVYGFCRMIKRLIDTYNPNNMILVWDSPGKTERHEIYQDYKKLRQKAPSDLAQQKNLIKEFAHLINLVQIEKEGVEADDLMYSLALSLEKQNRLSVLVTSDKDLRQVLSDKVIILDPFKDSFLTKEQIEEKLGFPINRLPFYYALIGDASDNIPGVRGIGPKTAQLLVQQFESLEDLYKRIDEVSKDRTKQLLKESKESAFLSLELFKLRMYEINTTIYCCTFTAKNWENARPLFERLEFKTFLKAIGVKETPRTNEILKQRYKFTKVTDEKILNEICDKIRKLRRCALDSESDSPNIFEGNMVGISLCAEEGESFYIPFGHKTEEKQLDRDYVLKILKPIFEDSLIEKYLHHAKFDALMLFNAGIELKGIVFDTLIAASLLVGDGQKIGLKYLSQYYLEEPMLYFVDVVKKNKYPDFSYVPLDLATEYAAADAHQTLRLYKLFDQGLHKNNLQELFHNLEMPLMHVLMKMEQKGILLDESVLKKINEIVSKELSRLHQEIIDLVGHEYATINLNSPKQLEELLFDKLKLPAVKRTAQKTSYSTDQEVLRELSKIHPIPALILRYRELFKLKSTYLDALGNYINPKTGRIHTTFSQTNVATGRLASSDPNLQNIPVDRFQVRSAFKAASNHIFISADYSQIELRVLGYLSQDETLIKAFQEDKDIHAITAAGLFDIPVWQVTSEQRQIGKRINFSILYGLTTHGLSKDLDISHSTAKNYIERFMAQYPGVNKWMENVIIQTKEKGYVETYFKRRRYLPGIYERNRTLYELARRVAINTIAQGTAAEIVKLGMLELNKSFDKSNLSANILLQIHDELLIEVPEKELDETKKLIKNTLEHVVNWNIPLSVTIRTGSNWQEVTK